MTRNDSFLGELLESAGMAYDAVDIADGYKTTIVDLNVNKLPAEMIGKYDAVINFGTSEHIINQSATFTAIHNATKTGGLIMHQLPSVGYVDHCYFTYTSRFFFDMAGYNSYEVVDFWFDVGAGNENVFTSARQYQTYFPNLTTRLEMIGKAERETQVNSIAVPTIGINVIFKKTKNAPFMGAVETSTSVGAIPQLVYERYRGEAPADEPQPEGGSGLPARKGASFAERLRLALRILRG